MDGAGERPGEASAKESAPARMAVATNSRVVAFFMRASRSSDIKGKLHVIGIYAAS
jgi:hypothetical protein